MEKSLAYVRTNISRWGVASIVLCAAAVAVPRQYPLCVFMPLLQISALTCSVVAAIRDNKRWLILSAITAILSAQAILFILVDC
jgi:hypothetical protein